MARPLAAENAVSHALLGIGGVGVRVEAEAPAFSERVTDWLARAFLLGGEIPSSQAPFRLHVVAREPTRYRPPGHGKLAASSAWQVLRNRLIDRGLFGILPALAQDAQYLHSSARAMARYQELGALMDRLAGAGIPVIPLKGIYLAKADYAEPGLRPMSDVGLLFRKGDLDRVNVIQSLTGASPCSAHEIETIEIEATSLASPACYRGWGLIESLYVVESERRRGLARRLAETATSDLPAAGATRIEIRVMEVNEVAMASSGRISASDRITAGSIWRRR